MRPYLRSQPHFQALLGSLVVGVVTVAAAAEVDDIDTVAGSGSAGYSGDGGFADFAKMDKPFGVALDAAGNIYIADTENSVIRKVDAVSGIITTIAGNGSRGYGGDGGPATAAMLKKPWDLVVDAAGNVFIADTENHRIRMVDAATGIIDTVVGSGSGKYFGDGGSPVGASVKKPHGAAYDGSGNYFIADTDNHRIRKVAVATGIITTIAGTGSSGLSGDGGPAVDAELDKPHGVAVDAAGNVFIADTNNDRIRRIDAGTGTITTVAGTSSGDSGDGGAATLAKLDAPESVDVDSNGNLFIADTGNDRVRKVDAATGIIDTIAGTGAAGYNGDGIAATTAKLRTPMGVDVRVATAFGEQTIQALSKTSRNIQTAMQVTLDGPATVTSITAYVGGRDADDVRYALYDDNGGEPDVLLAETAVAPGGATMAWLTIDLPDTALAAGDYWLALETSHSTSKYAYDTTGGQTRTVGNDASTNGFLANWGGSASSPAERASIYATFVSPLTSVYVADTENHRVRRFFEGNIDTLAGNGSAGYAGDGAAATLAKIDKPEGVAVDGAGNIYIADTENHRVRKVDTTGTITTVAGTGSGGYSGDDEPATASEVKKPRGIAVDAAGNVLLADTENHAVRRVVAATGFIETVAGSGVGGYGGDGGVAVGASVKKPGGIALDAAGNMYIADTENHVVRKVDVALNIITTIAGTNTGGYAGDGGPATAALVKKPAGVAVDGSGNVFIADTENHVIRRIDAATGVITTFAGTGTGGYGGDAGSATSAKLAKPAGVLVDSRGNVFIADTENYRIRQVDASTGIIETIAGTGSGGFSGDGGPAVDAKIKKVWGIALSAQGDLYIADTENHRIRMVDLPSALRVTSWREVEPGC